MNILYTVDISRYHVTRYCIQHNNFEGEISVTFRTQDNIPTGELWVSFVSYLEKSDHEISD